MGVRVTALGDALRQLALDAGLDFNEGHYLAHRALLRILRDDPSLVRACARSDSDEAMQQALRAAALEASGASARAVSKLRLAAHA